MKPKKILTIILLISMAVFLNGCVEKTQTNGIPLTTMPNTIQSELQITTIKEGTGEVTKAGDEIAVHYTGTLLDGTKFDSSKDRGQAFSFIIGAGEVIEGWDKGLLNMKVGEIRKLVIPAEMGYGNQQVGSIPANSTLVFEVELLSIN